MNNDSDLMVRPEMTPRAELERGLHFAYIMMMLSREQGNEAIAILRALTTLLVSKGLIEQEELQGALGSAREEVEKVLMPKVHLAEMGDKYEPSQNIEIDCEARIPLCHARCCSLRFFLTKQDLEEGVARWDYGNPYWMKYDSDGYCTHNDKATRFCTIHAKRPHVCRTYDCREDPRIWIDFEKRIPAPLEELKAQMGVAMGELELRGPDPEEVGE